MRPKTKLTAEHLSAAREFRALKKVNPVHAAALLNDPSMGAVIARGLAALDSGEQPEPDPTPEPPKAA